MSCMNNIEASIGEDYFFALRAGFLDGFKQLFFIDDAVGETGFSG